MCTLPEWISQWLSFSSGWQFCEQWSPSRLDLNLIKWSNHDEGLIHMVMIKVIMIVVECCEIMSMLVCTCMYVYIWGRSISSSREKERHFPSPHDTLIIKNTYMYYSQSRQFQGIHLALLLCNWRQVWESSTWFSEARYLLHMDLLRWRRYIFGHRHSIH